MIEIGSILQNLDSYTKQEGPRQVELSPRTPEETLWIIRRLMAENTSEKSRKRLLDPCVVLVLAGLKPQTFLYKHEEVTFHDTQKGREWGLLFRPRESPLSLSALTYLIHTSRICAYFNSNDLPESPNEEDVARWFEIFYENVNSVVHNRDAANIIEQGIALGYPDSAVIDCLRDLQQEQTVGKMNHTTRLIPAGIIENNPILEYLLEYYPSPDFDFDPSTQDIHRDRYVTMCRIFLSNFYTIPNVRALLEQVGVLVPKTTR